MTTEFGTMSVSQQPIGVNRSDPIWTFGKCHAHSTPCIWAFYEKRSCCMGCFQTSANWRQLAKQTRFQALYWTKNSSSFKPVHKAFEMISLIKPDFKSIKKPETSYVASPKNIGHTAGRTWKKHLFRRVESNGEKRQSKRQVCAAPLWMSNSMSSFGTLHHRAFYSKAPFSSVVRFCDGREGEWLYHALPGFAFLGIF